MRAPQRIVGRAGVIGLCAGAGFAWSSAQAAQVTANWLAPVSGSWLEVSNWSSAPFFPSNGNPMGTTYQAVIDATGGASYTVTLSTSVTLSSLLVDSNDALLRLQAGTLQLNSISAIDRGSMRMDAGTLSGADRLDVRSEFDWQGGNLMGDGLLKIHDTGTMLIRGAPAKTLLKSIENLGTMRWTNGDVTPRAGAVTNSGRFEIDIGGTQFGNWRPSVGNWTISFVNDGEIVKTGSGTAQIDYSNPGQSLINNGSVLVENGRLELITDDDQTGLFRAEGSGELQIHGPGSLTSTTRLEGSGRITLSGGAQHFGVTDMTGTLVAQSSAPTFHQAVNVGGLVVEVGSLTSVEFMSPVQIAGNIEVLRGTAKFSAPVSVGPDTAVMLTEKLRYDFTGAPLVVRSIEFIESCCFHTELLGAGDVEVTDSITGEINMSGTGVTTLSQGGTLTQTRSGSLARTFRNEGLATFHHQLSGSGTIENFGEVVLDGASSIQPLILNHGTVRKVGAGLSGVRVSTLAGSEILVEQGVLEFNQTPGNIIMGSVDVSLGAVLRARNTSFLSGSSLTGDGLLATSTGTTDFAPGTFQFGGFVELGGATMIRDSVTLSGLQQLGGTSTIMGGATVGGNFTTAAGLLTITGGLTLQPGASVVVSGGEARLGASSLTLGNTWLTGGKLQLDGATMSTGDLSWSGGTLAGAGTLVNTGEMSVSASLTKSSSMRIENDGAIDARASFTMANALVNRSLLTLGAGNTSGSISLSGATLTNQGEIHKVGTGTSSIAPTSGTLTALNNAGLVHLHGGSLTLSRVQNSGMIVADAGTTLTLSGAYAPSGGSIEGKGLLVVGSGVALGAADVEWDGALRLTGGAITLDGSSSLTSIEALAGTMTMAAHLVSDGPVVVGSATVNGFGSLRIGSGGSLLLSNLPVIAAPIIVDGSFNLSNATVTLNGGSLTTNGAGVSTGGTALSGASPGTWMHTGSLVKTGSGTLAITGQLTSFVNEGSVHVQGGTFSVEAASTLHGSVQVDAGAALRFLQPLTLGAGASISGAGALTFGNTTAQLGSQLKDFTGAFTQQSGNLTFVGWSPAGQVTLQAGTMTFAGAADVSTLTMQAGTLNFSEGATLGSFVQISGMSTFSQDTTIGTVSQSAGALHFAQGASLGTFGQIGGTSTFSGGVHVETSFTLSTGTATFQNELTMAPAAEMRLTGPGTLQLNGGPVSIGKLTQQSGTLTSGADVRIGESMTWSAGTQAGAGRTIVEDSASLLMLGPTSAKTLSRELINDGVAEWRFGQLRFVDGTLVNNGVFTAMTFEGLPIEAQGRGGDNAFINNGQFIKQGPALLEFETVDSPVRFVNRGLVEVREGLMAIQDADPNEGEFRLLHQGGLDIRGDFGNASIGELSFEVSGMKERGLSGLMTITGEASLAGTLTVTTPEAFQATWGDRWVVMTYGSVEGDFDVFDLPIEGFASRSDEFGVSDLRWYAERGETEYAVGVSHVADIDHDGLIGFADLNVIASNFNAIGSWAEGDVDGDGFVGFTDLNVVLSLFNVAAPRSVPGPGGLVVFALAAGSGLRRRRE